jgi:Na+/H+ antiporter NhaD/arsenite permease-like protein
MLWAIILFALTYTGMLAFSKYRPYIALGSALVFIVSGMLPLGEIFGAIDFNVLLMIAGTMGLVQLFIDSKMPARLADMVMEKVPNVQMAAIALSLFAGIISAFVDNVATVLMIAPVALEICRKLNTNPVPFIIGIAVSSNLQGAATLVGDTTAIMLGSYADMSFLDFFWYQGKPGIFFAVELGAVLSALILAWLFRREKGKIQKSAEKTVVTDYVPTILLFGTVVLLILASFIPNKPAITNGLICMALLVVGLIYNFIKSVIDAINSVTSIIGLGKINYPRESLFVIDKVPQLVLPALDYSFGNGGVVTGPTRALIGETGRDEAVIPLDNSPQMLDLIDKIANKVNQGGETVVKVYIGDREWDAFTYESAQRGQQLVGAQPITIGG